MTGAGKVVEAFAYACCAAVGVVNKWPARPFITAAQVLVAAIPKTLRGLCMQMHGSRHEHTCKSERNSTGDRDDIAKRIMERKEYVPAVRMTSKRTTAAAAERFFHGEGTIGTLVRLRSS